MSYEFFMEQALAEAEIALHKGEIPVGAIVEFEGLIVGRGHNLRESQLDPTAHAEVLALRQAAKTLGRWRLTGCSIFVTVEPCPMCAGSLVLARIGGLIYGCDDPKAGACGTLYNIVQDKRLNHQVDVIGGVLEDKCKEILSRFFDRKRNTLNQEEP